MNIKLNYFFSHAVSFFRESVKPSLTAQHKKIFVITSITFGFLAACYLAYRCCFKAKQLNSLCKGTYSDEAAVKDKFKNDETHAEEIFDVEASNPLGVTLEDLPQEVLLHILTFLDIKSLSAMSQANVFFHDFSQDPKAMSPSLKKFESMISLLTLDEKLELAKNRGALLTQINLEDSDVTDQQLVELFKACPNIRSLNLSYFNLTDVAIAKLPQDLRSLELMDCEKLTDVAIERLPKSLQSLSLSYCPNLTDTAIEKLPHDLRSLELMDCKNLTNVIIDKLPKDLQSLNLCFCPNLTDFDNLPEGLQAFDLSFCWNLTDASFANLPKGLQSLDISCPNITDAVITKLPQDLKFLKLSGLKLTDVKIEGLPKGLQSLDLSFCSKLTDVVFDNLPKGLQSLNLSGCKKLTDAAIEKLPKDLKFLKLSGCPNLTRAAIKRLRDERNIIIRCDYILD